MMFLIRKADMREQERKEMSKMSKRLADISARKQHALAQLKVTARHSDCGGQSTQAAPMDSRYSNCV